MNPNRLVSLALLAAVAFMHYRDIPGKLGETPYLGWMYFCSWRAAPQQEPGC